MFIVRLACFTDGQEKGTVPGCYGGVHVRDDADLPAAVGIALFVHGRRCLRLIADAERAAWHARHIGQSHFGQGKICECLRAGSGRGLQCKFVRPPGAIFGHED